MTYTSLAILSAVVLILGMATAKPVESEGRSGNLPRIRREEAATPSPAEMIPMEKAKAEVSENKEESDSKSPASPIIDFFSRRQQEVSDGVNYIVKAARGVGENVEKFFRDSAPSSSQIRDTAQAILDSIFKSSDSKS